jgi:hypothetical protein
MHRRAITAIVAALAAGAVLVPSVTASAAAPLVNVDFEADLDGQAYIDADIYGAEGLSVTGAFGIVAGLSQGDPGGWGLEGPDGPQFLGQNSEGPVTIGYEAGFGAFSIQCSRSDGSTEGDTLTATAYDRDDKVVGTTTVTFGDINEWSAINLSGSGMAYVVLQGDVDRFAPWGCDDLRLSAGPTDPADPTDPGDETTDAETTDDTVPSPAGPVVATPKFTG